MRVTRSSAAVRLALVVALSSLLTSTLAFGSGVVVIVGGDADHDTRRKLASAIAQGLIDHREESRQIALDAAEVSALVGCVSREASKECAGEFMRSRSEGASRAIVLSIAHERTKATITGWVLARDGTILVIDQGVCDACTPSKLEAVTLDLLGVLLREVEARTTPTILAVRTHPPGAQVEIDGRIVGESNAQGPVEYPRLCGRAPDRGAASRLRDRGPLGPGGRWRDQADRRGARAIAGHAAAGARVVAAGGSSRLHHHRTRWGAWLTLGTGAVVASTGIVLIVADQDAPRDPDVTQPFDRRETMTLGIVSVGLGVAAIGAGSWWLRRDTGPPRGAAASAPAVRVAPGSRCSSTPEPFEGRDRHASSSPRSDRRHPDFSALGPGGRGLSGCRDPYRGAAGAS